MLRLFKGWSINKEANIWQFLVHWAGCFISKCEEELVHDEKSNSNYFIYGTEDVSAAICEYIFDAWCREGYLTPKRISNILHGYSSYAKQNDILAWYRTFQDQIIKDDILYPMFMMNNIQLSGELQREQDKKID